MVDKQALKQEMVDKWSIKPSLAEKLVDILNFLAEKDEFTTEQIVSHFGFNLKWGLSHFILARHFTISYNQRYIL